MAGKSVRNWFQSMTVWLFCAQAESWKTFIATREFRNWARSPWWKEASRMWTSTRRSSGTCEVLSRRSTASSTAVISSRRFPPWRIWWRWGLRLRRLRQFTESRRERCRLRRFWWWTAFWSPEESGVQGLLLIRLLLLLLRILPGRFSTSPAPNARSRFLSLLLLHRF